MTQPPSPYDRFGQRGSHRRPEDWPPPDATSATVAVPTPRPERMNLPPIDDTDPRGTVPEGYADQGYDPEPPTEWRSTGPRPRGWNEGLPERAPYGLDPSGRPRRELVVGSDERDQRRERVRERAADVQRLRGLVDPDLNRFRLMAARWALARDVVLILFLLVGTLYLVLAIKGSLS